MRSHPLAYAALAGVIGGVLLALLLTSQRAGSTDTRVTHELAVSAHRACLSRRAAIEESNSRLDSHVIDRDVLRSFLASARVARLEAYAEQHHATDDRAAREYLELWRRLGRVRFHRLTVPSCPSVAELEAH